MELNSLPEDKMLSVVGARILQARTAARVSRESLANSCNVSNRHLFHVEHGRNVSMRVLHKVTTALGMNMSELFAPLNNTHPLYDLHAEQESEAHG